MQQWPGLKTFVALVILLVLHQSIGAQVAYHNFNSNDGLPSNEVYCEYQDQQGFLWFGTDHGVVKYNGYNFKTYTTADGLTDNTILAMKGDDYGNIWFLTLTGGMFYYDGKSFAPHPFNDTIKNLCNYRIPTSFEILANKQVWLGFIDLGVAKIDTDNVQLFKMTGAPYNSDTLYNYVWHLTPTRYVYCSFKNLVSVKTNVPEGIRIENCSFTTQFLPLGGINFSLVFLGNKTLLMDRWSHLICIDSAKHTFEYTWPRNNEIANLCQSSDGKTWMLLKNKPCYSIEVNDRQVKMVDSFTFVHNASCIMVDHQGNYWITTLDQGIFMVPNIKIRKFVLPAIPESAKLSCLGTFSNYLYVGIPEGRVLRLDKSLEAVIDDKRTKSSASISDIIFNTNGSVQTNLDVRFEKFPGIDGYPTKLLDINDGRLLIGMMSGIAIVDGTKRIYRSNESGFSERVTDLCHLSGKKYLIGTLKGLYHLSMRDGIKIERDKNLNDTRITSIRLVNPKMFGVASRGKGIFINVNDRFYGINEQRGLASDLAEDLFFENDSVLWVATFKGISKVYFRFIRDSLVFRIKNYTKEDGLSSNQVNHILGFNGYIWLATSEGLCYFKPENLTDQTVSLPLYFGTISVNGQKHSVDSLVLNYDENNVFIEFNAIYYKATQGIRYKVRLNGIGTWKYTNLNYIQYYSLPPGKYSFEVIAEDKDGKYRSDVHTLSFIIKPRFVDTVLFKILLGLTVLIILAAVISSIFSYQKLKATNVIKLLQAEFKALSYQINPHFIFNVLNSIQYYILKKDTDNAVHLLGSFSLLIRRIVNNSKQQYISIIEEVECLREYLDLEKMRLDNKFEYTINIDRSIQVEEKNILPMIIQPLVENSIWHGIVPSLKPGVISVEFKKEKGSVICIVEDNGVGINTTLEKKEKNQNNLSMAMENVRERLKIIGELNDSTWEIRTVDKSVADASVTGTIVTIIFPAVKK